MTNEQAECFHVMCERVTCAYHMSWDEEYDTLDEARDMAEAAVEQGEADHAVVTARLNPDLHQEYTKAGGWEDDE